MYRMTKTSFLVALVVLGLTVIGSESAKGQVRTFKKLPATSQAKAIQTASEAQTQRNPMLLRQQQAGLARVRSRLSVGQAAARYNAEKARVQPAQSSTPGIRRSLLARDRGSVLQPANQSMRGVSSQRVLPQVLPILHVRVATFVKPRSGVGPSTGAAYSPSGLGRSRPIANVAVSIVYKLNGRLVASGHTDAQGTFSARLKPGPFVVRAALTGYRPAEKAVQLGPMSQKVSLVLHQFRQEFESVETILPRVLPAANQRSQQRRTIRHADELRVVEPAETAKGPEDFAESIHVISPNGGEVLVPGRVHEIRWDTVGNVELPIISLLNGDAVYPISNPRDIYGTRTQAGWRWSWTVPRDLPAGSNYRIRLEAVAAPEGSSEVYSVVDTSDAPFTIAGRGVTLRGPRERDTVYVTSQVLLHWNSVGTSDDVRIMLFRVGTTSAAQVLFESAPSSGREYWTVGVGEGRGGRSPIAPGEYFLRAMLIGHSDVIHDTPVFRIELPELSVTAPDTSYTIRGDEPQTVRWTARHVRGDVNVELWTGDVRLATVARDVRVGSYRHTSTWFPDPGPGIGSFGETFRDVRVRLVSTSVPWFFVEGTARFGVTYD